MSRSRSKSKILEAPSEQGAIDVETDALPGAGVGLWGAVKLVAGLTLVLATSLGVAWGAYRFALTTSRFAITKMEVDGVARHSDVSIARLAGVRVGDNIFRIDVQRAESKLLDDPWIHEVKVSRKLPDTLHVVVSEHSAVASAVLGETLYLVNRDGVPFKEYEKGDPFDLPVLTGVSTENLGEDREREIERIELSLEALRQYGRQSLSRQHPAQEVHLEDDGSIVMTVGADAVTLELGHPPWRKKLVKATRVLGRVRAKGQLPGIVFLDNEAHPERVVVRMR